MHASARTLSVGPFAGSKNNRLGQQGARSPISPDLDSVSSALSQANESLFDLRTQPPIQSLLSLSVFF